MKQRKLNNVWSKILIFLILFFVADFTISKLLSNGLNKYYGLYDDSEIALVGHSHLMLGIDKIQIEKNTNKKVAKYTREGVDVLERKIMIEQLLETNKNIKTIIYGVDAWSFTNEGLSSNSYKLFYPFMENNTIGNYVKENSSWSDYYTKKIIKTSRYNELLLGGAIRGYLGKWSNLKFGKVDVRALKNNIAKNDYRKIEMNPKTVKLFSETMKLLSEKNIKVILLNVPTINLLIDAQNEKATEIFNTIKSIAVKYHNIHFLNFQEPFSHNHELFYDPIHMNPEGQKKVTAQLIKYLKNNKL